MQPAAPFQVVYKSHPQMDGKGYYWDQKSCRLAEGPDMEKRRNDLLVTILKDKEFIPDSLLDKCKEELKTFSFDSERQVYHIEAKTKEVDKWIAHWTGFAKKAHRLVKIFFEASQKVTITRLEVLHLAAKIKKYDQKADELVNSIDYETWQKCMEAKQAGKPEPVKAKLCGSIAVMALIVNNVMGACLMGIQTRLTDALPIFGPYPSEEKFPTEAADAIPFALNKISFLKSAIKAVKQAYNEKGNLEDEEVSMIVDLAINKMAAEIIGNWQPAVDKLFARAQSLLNDLRSHGNRLEDLYLRLSRFRSKGESLLDNINSVRVHYEEHHQPKVYSYVLGEDGLQEVPYQKNTVMLDAIKKIEEIVHTLLVVTNNIALNALEPPSN